ncbi:hypothetical protein ABPG72_015241 [Tetrahymena utriculariae]
MRNYSILLTFICLNYAYSQSQVPTYSEFKDCILKCQHPCIGQECIQNQDHQFISCYSQSDECHNWNSDYFNSLNTKTLDIQLFKLCFNKCKPEHSDSIFYKMYNCWRKCALGDER